jgi:hypothetical protein
VDIATKGRQTRGKDVDKKLAGFLTGKMAKNGIVIKAIMIRKQRMQKYIMVVAYIDEHICVIPLISNYKSVNFSTLNRTLRKLCE